MRPAARRRTNWCRDGIGGVIVVNNHSSTRARATLGHAQQARAYGRAGFSLHQQAFRRGGAAVTSGTIAQLIRIEWNMVNPRCCRNKPRNAARFDAMRKKCGTGNCANVEADLVDEDDGSTGMAAQRDRKAWVLTTRRFALPRSEEQMRCRCRHRGSALPPLSPTAPP